MAFHTEKCYTFGNLLFSLKNYKRLETERDTGEEPSVLVQGSFQTLTRVENGEALSRCQSAAAFHEGHRVVFDCRTAFSCPDRRRLFSFHWHKQTERNCHLLHVVDVWRPPWAVFSEVLLTQVTTRPLNEKKATCRHFAGVFFSLATVHNVTLYRIKLAGTCYLSPLVPWFVSLEEKCKS
jgi:hypothetical protein